MGAIHSARLWTFTQGVTTVPFTAKWIGLEYWLSGLGRGLSWCAAAGMLLFLLDRTGRFLLLMPALLVVPYAFTGTSTAAGEWRFTMLAYPIYLIASALAIERLLRFALRFRRLP